jgi:hypothetical protein
MAVSIIAVGRFPMVACSADEISSALIENGTLAWTESDHR